MGFLARRERQAGWGDARRGVYESLIRWSLIRLAARPMTARNWRPHVLVFTDDVERRLDLVRFGDLVQPGSRRGDRLRAGGRRPAGRGDPDPRQGGANPASMLDREGLVAFGEVDVVRDVIEGITDVAQANGIAGLDSNTILLGWPRDPDRLVEFLQVVERLERLNKSVVIGRIQPGLIPRTAKTGSIHIWWGGLRHNGDLMLLLAHLLDPQPGVAPRRNQDPQPGVERHDEAERTEDYLARFLPEIRIAAEAQVMLIEPTTARSGRSFTSIAPPPTSSSWV